jgi:hypothetical protein
MQTGCHGKVIQDQPGKEPDHQQPLPGNREWQPQDEQVVYIRSDEPMQVRYLVQHIHLDQDKEDEPDDIS